MARMIHYCASVQTTAVLLILMLAGAEGARVHEHRRFANAALRRLRKTVDGTAHDAAQTAKDARARQAWSPWSMRSISGSDVCRREDLLLDKEGHISSTSFTLFLERYYYKVHKLEDLSNEIGESEDVPLHAALTLRSRIDKFSSCMTMKFEEVPGGNQDNYTQAQLLRGALTHPGSPYSLPTAMTKVRSKMVEYLKTHGYLLDK